VHCSRHRNQETHCKRFGETTKESGKRKDQAAEQEEKKETGIQIAAERQVWSYN
jgi:hypothetical protein